MKILILSLIFIITTVIGYKIISDVPGLLHTPLMSGMNALSGVTILGALMATAIAVKTGSKVLGTIAIIFAMINVTGGFYVTHRMLGMFKTKWGDEK